jgi:hypothetical protein
MSSYPATADQKLLAVKVLQDITRFMPNQFPDWRDFVKPSHQHDMDQLLRDVAADTSADIGANKKRSFNPGILYPPPSLYFDRRVERVLDMFKTDINLGKEQLFLSLIFAKTSQMSFNDLKGYHHLVFQICLNITGAITCHRLLDLPYSK